MENVVLAVMYISCIVLIFAAGWIWGVDWEANQTHKLVQLADETVTQATREVRDMKKVCALVCAINDRLIGRAIKKIEPKKNAQKQPANKQKRR